MSSKKFFLYRAACLMAARLFFLGCTGGDDDGRRLGEMIVGTWQRGWGEGDVVIDGDTELQPENFTYDKFIFNNDGTYNGMVRKGTFVTIDKEGEVIFEGDYQCDNSNLRLEFLDEGGRKQKILAQIVSFTEYEILLRYDSDEWGVTVSLKIRKSS